MRIRAALVTALLWAAPASAAFAQALLQPLAQVGLQPLSDPPPADIDALLRAQWPGYYRGGGDPSFTPAQVRVGRIDLDGDGVAELLLLLEAPDWHGLDGGPLLVARWDGKAWRPVGWAYGDADGVYATAERLGGWASVDTGSFWLRWDGRAYRAEAVLPPDPPASEPSPAEAVAR
ncbi:MAG: hypothetical protein RLZZ501_2311 [Pseudomonadota bacterium]|jgi:hypothetical protein